MEEPEGNAPVRAVRQVCLPPPDGHGGAGGASRSRGELVDTTLLEEITLLSEVIVVVATYPTHLNGSEVDDVLGVHVAMSRS